MRSPDAATRSRQAEVRAANRASKLASSRLTCGQLVDQFVESLAYDTQDEVDRWMMKGTGTSTPKAAAAWLKARNCSGL